jgi:putative DNA primase/helicase
MTNNTNQVSNNELQQSNENQKAGQKSVSQGQAVALDDVEPWDDPVNASELLNDIASTFKRFAILPEYADTALALWVTFTWCIDSMGVAPILAISSPEKQCGKTTLLNLVTRLVANPLPTSNISAASLFRAVEMWQPTLLIDEADTFIRNSDELRGILNSGHGRASAFVIRAVGDTHEPRQFSTWAAKAIALIGKLPETLHDRSIVIELRRKLTTEKTERLRYANQELFRDLCRKLKRFSADNLKTLSMARPTLPENISDRAADNWEPLLAIAELAGETWTEKALQAAQALSTRVNDSLSLGTELLADIEAVFNIKMCDRISTTDLIRYICDDDERPWATYKRGHQISPRQIAKILSEYGIESKTIRIGTHTPKGFERHQFEDAFQRYLLPPTENADTAPHSSETAADNVADTVLVADTVYAGKTPKVPVTGACVSVAEKDEW